MKKYILSIPFLLVLLLSQNPTRAQLVKKTLTASEKTKLASLPKAPAIPKSSAAQISLAENYANAITVFTAKALLHKSDPAKYPMDAPAGSMEKRSMDFVNTLTAAQLKRVTDRLKATLAEPAKKAKLFGKYRNLDLGMASTTGELKKMDDKLVFSKTPDVKMPPPYTRIEFFLTGVYCIQKTTSSEDLDQIIVSGLLSGLNNEVYPGKALLVGNYASGLYATGALTLGYANLHPTETFPKTFYSYLLVIEYDGINIDQDAANLASQMESLANQLSGLEAQEAFYHNYVRFRLANAGEMGFWDDCLNVKEVPVVLANLNAFGSDKVSDELNTGDIYGWGAQYQITYKWRLIKD